MGVLVVGSRRIGEQRRLVPKAWLLEKNGRGLRLTPAGETLHFEKFFGELAATVQSLRAASVRKTALVLSCGPSDAKAVIPGRQLLADSVSTWSR